METFVKNLGYNMPKHERITRSLLGIFFLIGLIILCHEAGQILWAEALENAPSKWEESDFAYKEDRGIGITFANLMWGKYTFEEIILGLTGMFAWMYYPLFFGGILLCCNLFSNFKTQDTIDLVTLTNRCTLWLSPFIAILFVWGLNLVWGVLLFAPYIYFGFCALRNRQSLKKSNVEQKDKIFRFWLILGLTLFNLTLTIYNLTMLILSVGTLMLIDFVMLQLFLTALQSSFYKSKASKYIIIAAMIVLICSLIFVHILAPVLWVLDNYIIFVLALGLFFYIGSNFKEEKAGPQ